MAKEFCFVLSDEFHTIEVIAELSQLSERGIKHPVVLKQERSRYAVELARCIVLYLMIGCDLTLQFDQFIGLIIDPAQHVQPNSSERDQQPGDRQKRNEQLSLNTRRKLSNPTNQLVSELTWIRPQG
ncbi:hypothetical protein [Microvirga aerophila]|uniref:hypothetical protein n=1 Tax=Microvirga aerophila TaxID=670291 RepID=UPI001FED8BCE|nr:hypothetical protein [Microvirga aerophila]